MIKLRPHHLRGIEFFEGTGYDTKHIENMFLVIKSLNEEDSFTLTGELDDICSCCPNRINNRCKTQEKVLRYDKSMKDILNLEYDKEYSYRELETAVGEKIDYLLNETCTDCQWAYICHRKK